MMGGPPGPGGPGPMGMGPPGPYGPGPMGCPSNMMPPSVSSRYVHFFLFFLFVCYFMFI